MKNQDIIRILTEQELGTKNTNTSFLMMPLRLETMFKDHVVEEVFEPDRIYFTLKQAWELLSFMRLKYSDEEEKEALKLIEKLNVEVEKLDILYKSDKYLLIDVLKKMKPLLPRKAEVHDDWVVLIGKVERLQSIESMKYNRATDLLNQLEHHTNRLINTIKKPPFYGKSRQLYHPDYSQSAIYKAGAKHFRQCRQFILSFKKELNKVPWMTYTQYGKMNRLLNPWTKANLGNAELDKKYLLYGTPDKSNQGYDMRKNIPGAVKEAMDQFYKEWEALKAASQTRPIAGAYFSVDEFLEMMQNKNNNEPPRRYTKAVVTIFKIAIDAKKNNSKRIKDVKKQELVQVLGRTVCDYSIEKEFVCALMQWLNTNLAAKLNLKLLDKFDKYLYKKEMVYRKQKKCLCVRIYPDELAVTQALRQLTKNEYLSGRDFWLKYIFYTDTAMRESFWLAICDLWPAYRAAWIVRKTFPKKALKVLEKRAFDFRLEERSFEEYADEINDNFLNAFPMTYVDDNQQVFDVPFTELLPERFILQAVLNTYERKKTTICKYGHRLPQKLQLGLDLNNLEDAVDESQSQGHLFLNGSLRWMTDYDEAERMGMAITLPLGQFAYERLSYTRDLRQKKNGKWVEVRQPKNWQHKQRSFCFDAVYVLGINKESEDECETILSDLLEAHLYSDDGYSLLNIGTATNILTDEDQKTNAELFDTSHEALVEKYKHQPENCFDPAPLSPDEDLALLKKIFALRKSVLGNIKDRRNTLEHREILKARITNRTLMGLMDNQLVKLFDRNGELSDFLSNDVLARGPFPPIRIGSQPYGILPICDFRNLQFSSKSPLYTLHQILLYLTEKWNRIADLNVDYSDDQSNIPADTYLKIAGSTPISSYFQKVQSVKEMDRQFLLNPDFFNLTSIYGYQEKEQSEILKEIDTIIKRSYGAGWAKEEGGLESYLNGYDEIRIIEDDSKNKYHENFSDLEIPLLVGIVKEKVDHLLTATDEDKRDEEVKNLIIEFFDLFAYRLDAWMMGLLSNKLRKRIRAGRHRIGIGTYGWVFNLKQPKKETQVQKEPGEYILAPSVNQAITGAVLRSAYKNSRVNNMTDNALSVNLSSERVRNAIRIIEGVQNGLAIGTILGTDLERLMHEEYKKNILDLNAGIYNLRKLYPMVESKEQGNEQETDPKKKIKDNDITVVNGAKLLEDYRAAGRTLKFVHDMNLFVDDTSMESNDDEIGEKETALWKLLDRIDDEYDALTDVILSEGVYKLTQGQREAVDALMQSLDKGKNIPMPTVAEIPITSAQVDGSLVVALKPSATPQSKSLLACVEPKVDQWIGETIAMQESWKELGVSPSEMVYLSANKSAFLRYLELKNWLMLDDGVYNPEPEFNESFEAIELMLDNMRELLSGARMLRNDDLVKETGLPDGSRYETLQDKYDMAFERVQMLTENLTELLERQKAVQNPENEDYEIAVLPDDVMREALQLAAYSFSIGQTTAMDAVSSKLFVGTNTLYANADAFLETVRLQHAFFEKLKTMNDNLCTALEEAKKMVAAAEEKTYRVYTQALQKLLVSNMLIVPVFEPDDNVPLELLHKQKHSRFFDNNSSNTIFDNILSLSKVSPQMMRFHQLRLYQQWNALDDEAVQPVEIVPMQIPLIHNMHLWLGIEVKNEEAVGDAFTYMVVQPHNLPSPDDEKPLIAGIVLDHWIERIPYREQTAGLAFNYDQPDAEAPQALLLAVSTKDNSNNYWSPDMLLRTVKSTMHLVKCRSVEPDDLKKHAWTAGLFPLLDYIDNLPQ